MDEICQLPDICEQIIKIGPRQGGLQDVAEQKRLFEGDMKEKMWLFMSEMCSECGGLKRVKIFNELPSDEDMDKYRYDNLCAVDTLIELDPNMEAEWVPN